MKDKWRDVVVGDIVYVWEYSWRMLTFNEIEVPDTYIARVDGIEGTTEDFDNNKLVTFYCVRTDNGQKFKLHINGMLTHHRGIDIGGEYLYSNDSDSILAIFHNFESEKTDHYATMNKKMYEDAIKSIRTKADEIAKRHMYIIREQLKIINKNLKIKTL